MGCWDCLQPLGHGEREGYIGELRHQRTLNDGDRSGEEIKDLLGRKACRKGKTPKWYDKKVLKGDCFPGCREAERGENWFSMTLTS